MTWREVAVCCAASVGVACAPPQVTRVDIASAQALSVAPSDRSSDFSGTYQSPQSGRVVLTQHGTRLAGQYAYATEEYALRGELIGEVHGNWARVTWTEARSGRSEPLRSEGFVYWVAGSPLDRDVRLIGEQSFFVETEVGTGTLREHRYSSAWSAVRIIPPPICCSEDHP
jgi:hypothetical protein